MTYATYIFDLDGTLLNTLDDLAASVNYAMDVCSMPRRTIEEVRQFVGNGVKRLIELSVPDGVDNPRFDEAFSTFKSHYSTHSLDNTRPYDGVVDVMRVLRDNGKRIAVVSNKFYTATRQLCHHFFGDYVEVAIGESESIRRKPAPDTVVEALRQLGVDDEGAVYIGDSDVDLATARAAHLPCISVLWGFRDKDFLLSHGATTFVSTPADILNI